MRLTIEQLRLGVLLGGGALVLALGAVLVWAHLRAHERLRDLPSRLGVDVQREANGFTYSQTVGGRVVFTLHAKRATERRSGEAQLEDAGLVLYGDEDGRADRIYGRDFLYDRSAGVVKAIGTVQLDLAAAAPANAAERLRFASGEAMPGARKEGLGGAEPVHATTSGLSYTESTGVATTAERVTFAYEGVKGEAVGASYVPKNGLLTLEREVRVNGVEDGRAFTVVASHAVMDRPARRVVLTGAEVRGATDGGEVVRAGQMVLRMGATGGVERVDGTGGVEVGQAAEMAKAPEAELTMRRGSVPEELRMRGGVEFARTAGGGEMTGSARESESRFDEKGVLVADRLLGGVVVDSAGGGGERRRLTGESVELTVEGGRVLRGATAEGGAMLRVTRAGYESSVGAARLVAGFGGARAELERVTGTGSAVLRRTAEGLEETSRAAEVVARFAPGAEGRVEVSTVEETGGVVMDRELRRPGTAGLERTHATARELSYDAEGQRAVLAGDAVVREPDRVVKAERVTLLEATGDAEAEGGLQASFVPAGAGAGKAGDAEVVHAVGARAVAKRSDGSVTVFGSGGGGDARVWQGASQVEAPVLVLRQKEGVLDAHGVGDADGMVVRTVLVGEGLVGAEVKGKARARGVEVVRVRSGRLHFVNGVNGVGAEGGRRAEFTGGVELESRDGAVRSQRAVATLQRGGADGTGTGGVGMGGGVERVVAQGGVVVTQPGRTATGAEMVWTAADGLIVLTGTPTAPPEVTDAARGRVTGGAIRFRAGDSSVVVSGAAPDGRSGRVRTETRLRQ